MILRRPHERAVLAEYRTGAFFLKPSLDDFCKIVRAVVRHWPEMKRIARGEESPFLYLVRESSVVPLRKKGLG